MIFCYSLGVCHPTFCLMVIPKSEGVMKQMSRCLIIYSHPLYDGTVWNVHLELDPTLCRLVTEEKPWKRDLLGVT